MARQLHVFDFFDMFYIHMFFHFYVIKTIQIETLDQFEELHFPLTCPYSSFL